MSKKSIEKTYNKENNITEDIISIGDIIIILARNFKIIAIMPSITCIITIIYAIWFTSPTYVSTAKIMSSTPQSTTKMAGLASQFGIDLPTGQSEPNWVYDDIIKSRILARSMIDRSFDTKEFGKNKKLLQILTYGNDKQEIGLDTLSKRAVDSFIKMIELKKDIETGIYTLSIETNEAKLSTDLVASLIDELDSHQREYNRRITSSTRQFIEERISSTKKELESSEEILRVFTDRNRRIENSPLLLLEQQRLEREVGVLTGVYTTLKQQLETTKIEEVKDSQYVIVIDPPEIPIKKAGPNRAKMVIIAGVFGLALGIMFGLLFEFFEKIDSLELRKFQKAKSLLYENIESLVPNFMK